MILTPDSESVFNAKGSEDITMEEELLTKDVDEEVFTNSCGTTVFGKQFSSRQNTVRGSVLCA